MWHLLPKYKNINSKRFRYSYAHYRALSVIPYNNQNRYVLPGYMVPKYITPASPFVIGGPSYFNSDMCSGALSAFREAYTLP